MSRKNFIIRRLLIGCLLICFQLGFSEEVVDARTIDFRKMDISCIPGYKSLDLKIIYEEFSPFDNEIELCAYFSYLQDTFNLDTVIETGTSTGNTSAFFGFLFDEVHTMEIDVPTFQKALKNLNPFRNVKVYYGNSPDILRQILPLKKENRVLFYLDAYFDDESPLIEELELIGKHFQDNCIVVINGFKIPDRKDSPFLHFNGQPCAYDYIKSQIYKIFSSFIVYYIIPKSPNSYGKFVAIPRKRDFSKGWAQ